MTPFVGCAAPSLDTICLALADEGVPLRAIARVTQIPSADLRERLVEARESGSLVELPRDDWPPGFPRDQRAFALSRMIREDRPALMIKLRRLFRLRPTGVMLLLGMLQSEYLDKARLTEVLPKSIDVHIWLLRRRLAAHGIEIETLWGSGYRLSAAHRAKVMDALLDRGGAGS